MWVLRLRLILSLGKIQVSVIGLVGRVMVLVVSWGIFYIYPSPHKARSTMMCV